MADKKYLGLGIIFKAIDKGFSKSSKKVQDSLSDTSDQMRNVQRSLDGIDFNNFYKNLQNEIDGLDFGRMNELVSTFKIFEDSISGTDPFNKLQDGLYKLNDELINTTLVTKQIAQKKSLENYLISLRDQGRITQGQFAALSKGLNDISDLNFPKPDVEALGELNSLIKDQSKLIPKLKSGITGYTKSNLALEISIDRLNTAFEAQEKIKSINKYRLELQNLHNQGKITTKDFQEISYNLNKLSDTFAKQVKNPAKMFEEFKKKIAFSTKDIRAVGSSIFDLGKTLIANLPNVTEGLLGKGVVSDLSSKMDFLQTKMSLVMDTSQANEFQSAWQNTLKTTGATAEQTEALALAMNRYGLSVKDSNELLPFMGNLVGKMGLDSEQVAEMGGQLTRTLGMSTVQAEELTKQFYDMGKARGFVDFLQDMPEITKEVTLSFNKLGISNAKVAASSIKSTAALTGMYRKLGIEQKAAVQAALKMQSALTDMSLDIQRLSVGLEPENFDQMIDLAGEITRLTGKSADEAFKMIQDGAQDTDKFMMQMMDTAKNITNPKDMQRFGLIMRKTFGDEAANLATNADLREKAIKEGIASAKEQAKLNKQKENPLVQDQKALGNTLKVSQDLLKTNKELTKAMGELAAKNAIIQSWTAQIREWQNLQESIAKQDTLGKIQTLAAAIEAGGATAAAYLAGNDKLGQSLAHIGVDIQASTDAIKSLSGLTSSIQALVAIMGMNGVGGLIKSLLPMLGASAIGLGGIITSALTAAVPALLVALAAGVGIAIGSVINLALDKLGLGASSKDAGSWLGATAGFFGYDPTTDVTKEMDLANQKKQAELDAKKKNKTEVPVTVPERVLEKKKKVVTNPPPQVMPKEPEFQVSMAPGVNESINSWPDPLKSNEKEMNKIRAMDAKEAQDRLDTLAAQKKVPSWFAKPKMQTPIPEPTKNQEGAPTLSKVLPTTPATSNNETKNSSLDDVVKNLSDVKEEIKNINNKPVNVILQGDAKKFFKAVNAEGADRAGLRGLNNQVVFGGG